MTALVKLYGLVLEYYECLLDLAITLLKTKKDEFILQLRLMEAIEHEFFSDLANMELVSPIQCFEEKEIAVIEEHIVDVIPEKPKEHDDQIRSSRIVAKEEGHGRSVDDKMEKMIIELLANMNLKDVKSVDKENVEKILGELFSTMRLRDEPLKNDLVVDEVAAFLAELSLGVDSLDTFDRDLAVFDRDGNIIVEDYCVYSYLSKVLLDQYGENESLRRLLLSKPMNNW